MKDRQPTLREILAAHRDKPACASCHNRLDPPGLALENFNALGQWRNQEFGQPVEAGGTLITLASSGELPIEEFNLPVRNVLGRVRPEEFSSPGSLLRINLDPHNPLAYGMPEEAAAFVNEPIAYQTSIPGADIERSVVAWYPTDSEDILLSGWINGADRLARHAAAVTLTYGKGKIALLGFRVQNRAQTEGTFKLLFNAIQWAGTEQ